MKPQEIRELSPEELDKKIEESRKELFNLRFQMATSQLENTSRVKIVKKDIARMLTIKHEREIEAADKAKA